MVLAYWQRLQHSGRDVWLALLAWAFFFGPTFGFLFVLFNLYLVRLGFGTERIGMYSAVGWLSFATGSVLAGVLGRRHNPRRMMILGALLSVPASVLSFQAEVLPVDWQATWILVMVVLGNVGAAWYVTNNAPFLVQVSSTENRTHVFSLLAAVGPLAAFTCSLLAGALPGLVASILHTTLTQTAPYRWVLTGGMLLQSVGLLAIYLTKAEPRAVHEKGHQTSPFPVALIAVVAAVCLLRWAGVGPVYAFLNVYLDRALHASTSLIGSQTALAQLASIPAALLAPALAARVGRLSAIWGSMVMIAVGLLPLGLIAQEPAAVFSNVALLSLGAIANPLIMVYSQELVGPEWRAAMMAGLNSAQGLGVAATALSGGYLISAIGFRTVFLAGVVLTLAAGLVFWGYFRLPRGEPANLPAQQPVRLPQPALALESGDGSAMGEDP